MPRRAVEQKVDVALRQSQIANPKSDRTSRARQQKAQRIRMICLLLIVDRSIYDIGRLLRKPLQPEDPSEKGCRQRPPVDLIATDVGGPLFARTPLALTGRRCCNATF